MNGRDFFDTVFINIGIPVFRFACFFVHTVNSILQVLKRPVGTYQISFDLDLKAPKKSKAGKNKQILNR